MASADVIAITKWAISGSEKAYGNSLNPVDAKGILPPAYPPPQTCWRQMVLQRKSNTGTMNPHRSSADEQGNC
jgi:hypothetical protein